MAIKNLPENLMKKCHYGKRDFNMDKLLYRLSRSFSSPFLYYSKQVNSLVFRTHFFNKKRILSQILDHEVCLKLNSDY